MNWLMLIKVIDIRVFDVFNFKSGWHTLIPRRFFKIRTTCLGNMAKCPLICVYHINMCRLLVAIIGDI